MGEIATWAMIHAKIPSFPAPTSGHENECLTKSEITSKGGVRVNGSYGNSECVMLDDIELHVFTQEIVFRANDLRITKYDNTVVHRINVDNYVNQYINEVFDVRYTPTLILNSPNYIDSPDGGFSINVSLEGSYIDVMLMASSMTDGEPVIISITQYYPPFNKLNIKVFYTNL